MRAKKYAHTTQKSIPLLVPVKLKSAEGNYEADSNKTQNYLKNLYNILYSPVRQLNTVHNPRIIKNLETRLVSTTEMLPTMSSQQEIHVSNSTPPKSNRTPTERNFNSPRPASWNLINEVMDEEHYDANVGLPKPDMNNLKKSKPWI